MRSLYDLDLFRLNVELNSNFYEMIVQRCKYYSPYCFRQMYDKIHDENRFSLFHTNIRSLNRNLENPQTHVLRELNYHFKVIGVTETRITTSSTMDYIPSLPNYVFEFVPTPLSAGGVGIYIDNSFKYTVIEKEFNEAFQALWIEINHIKSANVICGVLYRQHNSPERFLNYFEETIVKFSNTVAVKSFWSLCCWGIFYYNFSYHAPFLLIFLS